MLIVDGPGRGSALRHQGIVSRPDWEVPATAAYEYLARRPEADPAVSRSWRSVSEAIMHRGRRLLNRGKEWSLHLEDILCTAVKILSQTSNRIDPIRLDYTFYK